MNNDGDEFIDQVTAIMPRLLRSLLEREHNDLAVGVLTFAQYNVLLCLYDQRPQSMHAISNQLRMTPSNLTGMMNRLVSMEMVNRFNSDDDRRMVMAQITPRGLASIDSIMMEKRRTLRQIYNCLSIKDRENYIRIISRTLYVLESMSDDSDPVGKET